MSRDILKRNIAEERLRLGMTQEDLARRLNVSTSTISLYETGARVPNIDGIESLCSIFRTSIDKLTGFREDGDDPAEQFETAVGKIFQSMGFSVARKKETRNIPADEYFRDFPEEIPQPKPGDILQLFFAFFGFFRRFCRLKPFYIPLADDRHRMKLTGS